MKIFKIILFLFTLAFLSCSKEVEVDIPLQKPKMVIVGNLSLETPVYSWYKPPLIHFKLESTTHIFDPRKQDLITDALVILKNGNNYIDTLQYLDSLESYVCNEDTLRSYLEAGKSFSLEVVKDGFENIMSTTTIPKKVEILNSSITTVAFLNENENLYSEANIEFKDPEEANYYEIIVVNSLSPDIDQDDASAMLKADNPIITSESYYPSLMEFDKEPPKSLLFSDKSFNGQMINISVFYHNAAYNFESSLSYHRVTIYLRNVSPEYYTYKTRLMEHLYALDENVLYGSGEPVQVYSNIEQGYGLFGSYNVSHVTHDIDGIVLNLDK